MPERDPHLDFQAVRVGHVDPQLQLFQTHRVALIDYAAPIIGSRAQAEDVVQEAWLRFAAAREPDIQLPLAYLYRTVRNLALDALRRNAAESRRDQAYAESLDADAVEASPEESLAQREELALVAAALGEVAEVKRTAFELSRFGGLTFHQIADRLGISPATAHRHAQEVLLHLMKQLRR
jgi:RNA polymerase sigma factor (sigma-70 family)